MALSNRFFGGPRNFVQDPRPPQKPPKSDTSVLVHDCFDQFGGETQPEDCGCTQRIGRLEADALVRRRCADALAIVRYGKRESKRGSIVLRPDFVVKRRLKLKINSQKLLPAILKHGSILSFKKNVIRNKSGSAAITLEMNRTDAKYWNTVLVDLGLGAEAGRFLKGAALGMGVPASFTSLENFQMAPVKETNSLDPAVDEMLIATIRERKEGVRRSRHRVGAAGFRKGAGGLEYNEWGKIKGAPSIFTPGSSRDSDERFGEAHETTGQMNSRTKKSSPPDDPRTLPEGVDEPDLSPLD
jgi:hypothetical protein